MLSAGQIIERLEEIERDLAERQNEYEAVAEAWSRAKREKELAWANAYTMSINNSKNVTDRKASAIQASAMIGLQDEARYTALKGVVEVLNTRAMIGMALLKSQGRN